MVCKKCKNSVDMLIPIDPSGTKNRRWICSGCLGEMPRLYAKYLWHRGKRRTVKMELVVLKNRLLNKIGGY